MHKNRKPYGLLIVCEGPDGVGKSTISEAVEEYFRGSKNEFQPLSFPGRGEGTLGKLVYDLHHSPQQMGVAHLNSKSQQLLHIAAHIDAIEEIILPALK